MIIVGMLLAGAVGALLRNELSGWLETRARSRIPLGTAAVNVLGTVLLAVVVALHQSGAIGSGWLLILGTGFSGAFTTFSAWMLKTVQLAEKGTRDGYGTATLNIVIQFSVALVAAALVLALLG